MHRIKHIAAGLLFFGISTFACMAQDVGGDDCGTEYSAIYSNGHDAYVLIDKQKMMLRVFDINGKKLAQYPIACGKGYGEKNKEGDSCTPEGVFHIEDIQNSASWAHVSSGDTAKTYGVYGPYFYRLAIPGYSGIGIHGTNAPRSIGNRISNGCIRLHNANAKQLKQYVSVGTTVIITPSTKDEEATLAKNTTRSRQKQATTQHIAESMQVDNIMVESPKAKDTTLPVPSNPTNEIAQDDTPTLSVNTVKANDTTEQKPQVAEAADTTTHTPASAANDSNLSTHTANQQPEPTYYPTEELPDLNELMSDFDMALRERKQNTYASICNIPDNQYAKKEDYPIDIPNQFDQILANCEDTAEGKEPTEQQAKNVKAEEPEPVEEVPAVGSKEKKSKKRSKAGRHQTAATGGGFMPQLPEPQQLLK